MARRPKPFEDSLRAEILQEMRRFSIGVGTIPNPHVFWKKVLPEQGYKMAWGVFQREWIRLQAEGWIKIDPRTGAPIIVDLVIVEKETEA